MPEGDQEKIVGKHEIDIWSDGERTRGFMCVDDCIVGTFSILNSSIAEAINLGSDEMVSINRLMSIVEDVAGVKLKRTHQLDAPKGALGRNSNNTLIKRLMG